MVKQVKKIIETTKNRGEFNRAYKVFLERTGKIHCSYCGYHRGENSSKKWYGGHGNGNRRIKYPNWKLVSRNRKQWMKKLIKIEIKIIRWSNKEYTDITW